MSNHRYIVVRMLTRLKTPNNATNQSYHVEYSEAILKTCRFTETIFVLIWSLLGFGEGNTPDLNRNAPLSSITNNPSRITHTEWFGYVIYGLYVFAAIVVLMNLLIAVMSNTFQEVQVRLLKHSWIDRKHRVIKIFSKDLYL